MAVRAGVSYHRFRLVLVLPRPDFRRARTLPHPLALEARLGRNRAGADGPVSELAEEIAAVLGRDLRRLEEEVRAYPDEDSLWRTVPGTEDPGGALANHVAGTLLHYVGAVLGDSGYVRDRRAEFESRDLPRNQLLARIDRARAVVEEVLSELDGADLARSFPETSPDASPVDTAAFLIRLTSHVAYHLGQVNYHRRHVADDEP